MSSTSSLENYVWYEKYRPRSLDHLVLEDNVRSALSKYIADQNFPHLLFYGSAGSGKTTIAKILTSAIPCSVLTLNASGKDRSIETMRTDVVNFARSMPPRGTKLKVVFLDEADGISAEAQKALKNTIETYSDTCRFILTSNHANRIIDPIRSRCTAYAFQQFSKEQAFAMCKGILTAENITVANDRDIHTIIDHCYPDIRSLMNTLQMCSISGTLDSTRMEGSTVDVNQVIAFIKTGKVKSLRQTIAGMTDFQYLYRDLFDSLDKIYSRPDDQGSAAQAICQHLFYDPTIPDREINFVTCCAELMIGLNVGPDFTK